MYFWMIHNGNGEWMSVTVIIAEPNKTLQYTSDIEIKLKTHVIDSIETIRDHLGCICKSVCSA